MRINSPPKSPGKSILTGARTKRLTGLLAIGFADGQVIASGSSPVTVFHAAEASGLHPFFICVGKEEEPCRIRRASFPYDATYSGEPLPLMSVEFRQTSGVPGVILDRVIPDTGADASVLPWVDCQQLQLSPAMGVQGLIRGVGGSSAATLAFQVWTQLDGQNFPCRLQADLSATNASGARRPDRFWKSCFAVLPAKSL